MRSFLLDDAFAKVEIDHDRYPSRFVCAKASVEQTRSKWFAR